MAKSIFGVPVVTSMEMREDSIVLADFARWASSSKYRYFSVIYSIDGDGELIESKLRGAMDDRMIWQNIDTTTVKNVSTE